MAAKKTTVKKAAAPKKVAKKMTAKKAVALKKAAKPETPAFQQVFKTVDDLIRKDAGYINEYYVNKVFIADSREMREIPSDSIGLVVTSPPYFNIKDYAMDGRQSIAHSKEHVAQIGDIANFDNFIDELVMVWKECFRVMKPNGKMAINVPLMPMLKADLNTHENRHIFDLNSAIQKSILKNIPDLFLLDTYIWNRTNPSKKLMFGSYPYPSNFYAQNTIEFVSIYVKKGKAIQPSKEIKEESKLTQDEWVEYTKQIWNLPIPGKGDMAFGIHSALMPESLAERCIRLFSFVGETVLDPFAGSGTTLRVAKRLNRNFVGYELMDSYSEIINKKLESDVCYSVKRSILKKEEKILVNDIDKKLLDKVQVGDYSKLLKVISDYSVDLICVDPPYNMSKAEWDTFSSEKEFLTFTYKWISDVEKKLKPGGSFYIFNTPRNSAYILTYLESIGYTFQNWITWNKKDGFSSTKNKFLPEQESIIYVTKPGGKVTFNADQVRVPYESTERIEAAKTKGILKNGKRWYPNQSGRLCPDVWGFTSDRHVNKENGRVKAALHPTVKPLALLERIILASSNVGDVVLDIFAGSGTTLVAAKRHNRRFIGIDSNADYVTLAKSRIRDGK